MDEFHRSPQQTLATDPAALGERIQGGAKSHHEIIRCGRDLGRKHPRIIETNRAPVRKGAANVDAYDEAQSHLHRNRLH